MRWIEFVVARYLSPEAGLARHEEAEHRARTTGQRADRVERWQAPATQDDMPSWTARRAAAWRAWAQRGDVPATKADAAPAASAASGGGGATDGGGAIGAGLATGTGVATVPFGMPIEGSADAT